MAYKQFPTDKYLAELRKEVNIEAMTKPIIQKHNAELRAKVKPTVEELPPTASDNEIRSALTNELSKVLKAPDVPYVIESLFKANDLRSFYRFSKAFLNQIKDIRNLDASFLLDRWSKFKSQMLIESERVNAIPFQGQTAAEYEKSLRRSGQHVYTAPSSGEINEAAAMGREDLLPIINELKKYRQERQQLENELSIAESARQRSTIMRNLDKLAAKESRKQHLLNTKQIQGNVNTTSRNKGSYRQHAPPPLSHLSSSSSSNYSLSPGLSRTSSGYGSDIYEGTPSRSSRASSSSSASSMRGFGETPKRHISPTSSIATDTSHTMEANRGPGRPPGSGNKPKTSVAEQLRRGRGLRGGAIIGQTYLSRR